MNVWVLGSGSSGNAVLLESGETRLLVDAGFGPRTLARRMRAIGIDAASITGCVLTHDHDDHVGGAVRAAMRWGWQLFATDGTARSYDFGSVPVTTFTAGATLRIGAFDVQTIVVPHDATEPIGVLATETSSGARASICYDVGHADDGVRALCADVDVLILEANHDEGMLWAGPYPRWLCQRIAGTLGHLSNRAAAAVAREAVCPQLAHLVLAHVSETNNSAALADRTVRAALRRTAFKGRLSMSNQDAVVGPFTPRSFTRRSAAPVQLALGL